MAAPNGPSQSEVMRHASPVSLDFRRASMETHGTGTAFGDPIEFGALRAVFGSATASSKPVVLGAKSSRLGHTEGVAGLVGFLKAVLSLQSGAMAPNLHLCTPNPKLDMSDMSFILPSQSIHSFETVAQAYISDRWVDHKHQIICPARTTFLSSTNTSYEPTLLANFPVTIRQWQNSQLHVQLRKAADKEGLIVGVFILGTHTRYWFCSSPTTVRQTMQFFGHDIAPQEQIFPHEGSSFVFPFVEEILVDQESFNVTNCAIPSRAAPCTASIELDSKSSMRFWLNGSDIGVLLWLANDALCLIAGCHLDSVAALYEPSITLQAPKPTGARRTVPTLGPVLGPVLGVHVYGMSGTNAHVTLMPVPEAPAQSLLRTSTGVLYKQTSFPWSEKIDPLIGSLVSSPGAPTLVWERCMCETMYQHMAAHFVGEVPLAPGTGFIQMARVAVSTNNAKELWMDEVRFTGVLFLDNAQSCPNLSVSYNKVLQSVSVESISSTSANRSTHVIVTNVSEQPCQVRHAIDLSQLDLREGIGGQDLYSMTGSTVKDDYCNIEDVWFPNGFGGGISDELPAIIKIRFAEIEVPEPS